MDDNLLKWTWMKHRSVIGPEANQTSKFGFLRCDSLPLDQLVLDEQTSGSVLSVACHALALANQTRARISALRSEF